MRRDHHRCKQGAQILLAQTLKTICVACQPNQTFIHSLIHLGLIYSLISHLFTAHEATCPFIYPLNSLHIYSFTQKNPFDTQRPRSPGPGHLQVSMGSWKPTRPAASHTEKSFPWASRVGCKLCQLSTGLLGPGDLSYFLWPQETEPGPTHLS